MPPRKRAASRSTARSNARSSSTRKKTTPTKKTTARKKATTPAPPPTLDLNPGERAWLVDAPYEARAFVRSQGARWFPDYGWVYVGAQLPQTLAPWEPKRYSWQEFLQRHELNKEPLGGNPASDPSTGAYTLRPDQAEDANAILTARGFGAPEFILASMVGVGKTLTAISAVKRMSGVRRVLVVCPLSVAPNWRRTLQTMGDGGKEWVIINYQSTKKLMSAPASALTAKTKSTRNRRIANQGVPRVDWDVVITDESHYLGNLDAQMTKVMDKVVNGTTGHPAFTIRMSATAGTTPAKFGYAHRGLMWRTGNPTLPTMDNEQFTEWCTAQGLHVEPSRFSNGLSWAAKGNPALEDADTTIMHNLLFGGNVTWAVRRIPDWPEQQRILLPIEFTPEEWDAYQVEWREFTDTMRAIERQTKRLNSSPTKTSDSTRQELNQLKVRGLAALNQYRQKATLLRAAHTADFIADLVNSGVQAGVSFEYLASLEEVRARLADKGVETAVYTGRNPQERENERIAYQRGQVPVILYTPTEGFNLHAGEVEVGGNNAPRVGVAAEPRWRPDQALQAEGRNQRNGTEAPCYYPYALNTVEERVLTAVIRGMRSTNAMMGDDVSLLDDLSATLGFQLLGV